MKKLIIVAITLLALNSCTGLLEEGAVVTEIKKGKLRKYTVVVDAFPCDLDISTNREFHIGDTIEIIKLKKL